MLSAIILLEYEGRLGPNPTSGDRIKAMSDTVEALGLVQAGPNDLMELTPSQKSSLRLNLAHGEDLDKIGRIRCLWRKGDEPDALYRERLRSAMGIAG